MGEVSRYLKEFLMCSLNNEVWMQLCALADNLIHFLWSEKFPSLPIGNDLLRAEAVNNKTLTFMEQIMKIADASQLTADSLVMKQNPEENEIKTV